MFFLHDVVSRVFLRATTDAVEAARGFDSVITAVPTPVRDSVAGLFYLRGP